MIDTSILFKPFKVNGLELPNRIVMSPMGRCFASGGVERLERAEFDMVAVGRVLMANPHWANLVRRGAWDSIKPYANEMLYTLH
jgi:2,4-dienoyl-CoA reductase-like NADH-dependent reductase (Old Yellow Enzyme family)